jgi:hypothetical protein
MLVAKPMPTVSEQTEVEIWQGKSFNNAFHAKHGHWQPRAQHVEKLLRQRPL